jgi:hypothetical protein
MLSGLKAIFWVGLVCVIEASCYAGNLVTNGILDAVQSVLPAGIRRANSVAGTVCLRGHLGAVPHFYIGLLDGRSQTILVNNQTDALLIFVPGDYVYPNATIEQRYKNSFLAKTSKFQAFLLLPTQGDQLWTTVSNKLKDALIKLDSEGANKDARVPSALIAKPQPDEFFVSVGPHGTGVVYSLAGRACTLQDIRSNLVSLARINPEASLNLHVHPLVDVKTVFGLTEVVFASGITNCVVSMSNQPYLESGMRLTWTLALHLWAGALEGEAVPSRGLQ